MTDAIQPTLAEPPIEATGGTYYRWARFVMAAILFAYGIASIRDGFYRWPQDNAAALQAGADKLPHNDMGILINQLCGVALPPLGVGLLIWTLYRSRGLFRLAGGVLSAPGHPSVPLDEIQALDQSRWERKGIAIVEYTDDEGGVRKLTLDDFVYQRRGIDAIVSQIEQVLAGPAKSGGPRNGNGQTQPAAAPRQAMAPTRLPPRPRL